MKVAIAICIVFVVVNSVYSEDSSNKDSALSRETRDASPGRRKDSKSTRKEKKKKRKLKKKNEGKSKRNKNSKNVNKEKKRQTKKAQRKKKSKNVNKAKKKANSTQKKKKKTKTNRRNGKKRSRQGKRKIKKKDKKVKKKKKDNKKKTNIKSKDQDMRHNKVNQVRKTKQDNNSSSTIPKTPLKCTNNTKAVNFWKQNKRYYDKYNLLQNKLDKISVFKGYASVLGKLTDNGTKCTDATAGYILLSGCETSAAVACDNTEFNANYSTAIECANIINCNLTKMPKECQIKDKLKLLVEKTKECTNKKIVGSFSYCMTYVKENVSSDISECLNEAPATTPAPPPATTPTPNVTETKTIFTEGNETVEQSETYNPDTKELTLSVPAHGDNVALTAIIGVDQMVTSYDNYCVLGDPPADHTTEVYENSESTDDADELNSDSVDKVYTFNVVEGALTDAERAELPESFQNACKDKPIQKTRRIVVDKATFYNDSLISLDDRLPYRQGECSSQKTSCSKFDGGCYFSWTNPAGGIVKVHGLPKTVHCLSCCEEKSTSTLCQCSTITDNKYMETEQSETSWKSCYKKTNGLCPFNGWKCDSTDTCIEYSEQCDGECYGTLEKCGDKCIVPGTSQNFYLCDGKCYKNTQSCNGECPAKPFPNPNPCGKRCLTDRQAEYYWQCNGKCIPQSRPCIGVCPPGRVDCNGYCYSQSYFEKYWWKCEGKCVSKSTQCNGSCPLGREKCGDNMCLCDVDDPKCYGPTSKYYRDCDGTCISNWQPCNKTCVSGYNFCNYTYYTYNRDICRPASYFPKYYQYCGDCDQCTWSRAKCPPHESSTCPAKPPGEQAILLTSPSTTTVPSTTTPVMVTLAGRKRRFYQ